MIMEAESLRQIGPAAEYGPHNILWKQRGVCDCIRMYVLLYSTILFHSIHAEFMHVYTCIVQNIQTSGTEYFYS